MLLKLLMKTTNTAQYAADAANSSCRRAFVNKDIAAEKRSVKTIKTPTASKVELRDPMHVSLYMATTGSTRRTKITHVISSATNVSIRAAE